jgi:hypothetical protein
MIYTKRITVGTHVIFNKLQVMILGFNQYDSGGRFTQMIPSSSPNVVSAAVTEGEDDECRLTPQDATIGGYLI